MHYKSFAMYNNFPIVSESVPSVRQFIIFIDDSMVDNEYLIKASGNRTTTATQTTLFDAIQEAFMKKASTFEEVLEVTANTDSAILLRDFVDSWVSEKEIQKKAGTWTGA